MMIELPTLSSIAEDLGFDSVDEMLDEYMFESVVPACCEYGCMVEQDGRCQHGNVSILLKAGLI